MISLTLAMCTWERCKRERKRERDEDADADAWKLVLLGDACRLFFATIGIYRPHEGFRANFWFWATIFEKITKIVMSGGVLRLSFQHYCRNNIWRWLMELFHYSACAIHLYPLHECDSYGTNSMYDFLRVVPWFGTSKKQLKWLYYADPPVAKKNLHAVLPWSIFDNVLPIFPVLRVLLRLSQCLHEYHLVF